MRLSSRDDMALVNLPQVIRCGPDFDESMGMLLDTFASSKFV